MQIVNSTSTVPINLNTDPILLVGPSGVLAVSTDFDAVGGSISGMTVNVAGMIVAHYGIRLQGASLSDGLNALIRIYGDGVVSGHLVGVLTGGSNCWITNMGEITGALAGVGMGGSGASQSRLINYGTIFSETNGVSRHSDGANAPNVIRNYGLIHGLDNAYTSSNAAAVDDFRNRGTLVGDVMLHGGNDLFDNRGGTLDGTLDMGTGNDTARPGMGEEVMLGGADLDVLDFGNAGGITVDLTGLRENTGRAEGDTYGSFEWLLGGLRRADDFTGRWANEILVGQGGNDTLSGMAGNDTLHGGLGKDVMAGGTGADVFLYNLRSEAGDVITDFDASDRFRIAVADFGGGLSAGTLASGQFRTRSDNQAQDANDRFILRTTDATLWYDENGNAAGGQRLLADLQAGAVVTASDIVLV
jgi:Ca2+-binding RTX toxin-like protein